MDYQDGAIAMSEKLTYITLVDKPIHQLLPGEVTLEKDIQVWYIGCPGEQCGAGNLAGHTVNYDEQAKMLTVSPSILCLRCGAHYFVERNQIRWC
jgi:hypothetical protein